jgi:hypothetical protein
MSATTLTKLTNAQVELLKAFAHDLNDDDIVELRRTLAKFFAEKTANEADRVWEQKAWNDDTVDQMLSAKWRSRS